MKRKVVFAAMSILAAAGVFAQLAEGISFSAWGRGAFVPLVVATDAKDDEGKVVNDGKGNTYVGTGSIRRSYAFEQELYLTGNSAYVGFQLGLSFDGGKAAGPSSAASELYWYNDLGAAIWVKPLGNEWLKITGGTFIDETLRGKVGEVNGGWEQFVLGGTGDGGASAGKDQIFTGFAGHSGERNGRGGLDNLGFMISSSPLEGLFIGARVNAPGNMDLENMSKAEEVYRFIQIGAGYEIPGIGHARIQYLGGYAGKQSYKKAQQYIDDNDLTSWAVGDLDPEKRLGFPARMEAAFALTAVDDLVADVGIKYYFPVIKGGTVYFDKATTPGIDPYDDPYLKAWKGVAVSAGAIYSNVAGVSGLNLNGRVDSTFGAYRREFKDAKNLYNWTDNSPTLTLDVRLVPSYDLGFATVGFDAAYKIMEGSEIDENGDPVEPLQAKSKWGIGAFISRSFPNGYIKGGITYTSPTIYANKDQLSRTREIMIQIPFILEYSF